MTKQVQFRRGTNAQHSTFTGAAYEMTVNTDQETVHVHDGALAGGRAAGREDASNMSNPQLQNATAGMLLPDGTVAQRPDPASGGQIRFNTSYLNSSVEIYDDGSGDISTPNSTMGGWTGINTTATNLYKRSPTEGTYTATLNENIHNFTYIYTRSSQWRNLKCFHVDTLASGMQGTTNSTSYGNIMIDTYLTYHSYIQINTGGNQLLLGSGQGNTPYEVWGIR